MGELGVLGHAAFYCLCMLDWSATYRSNEEAAEKFPTPSTVQKKDLLHQKLSQKDQDLRQAQDKLRAADRQIKGLHDPP